MIIFEDEYTSIKNELDLIDIEPIKDNTKTFSVSELFEMFFTSNYYNEYKKFMFNHFVKGFTMTLAMDYFFTKTGFTNIKTNYDNNNCK